jgi:hypothetical protein
MPDDDEALPSDADEPPIDLPTPDDFVASEGTATPVEGVELGIATDLGYDFCLRYNQRPSQTVFFCADTAAEAAGWMEALSTQGSPGR